MTGEQGFPRALVCGAGTLDIDVRGGPRRGGRCLAEGGFGLAANLVVLGAGAAQPHGPCGPTAGGPWLL